MNKHLMVNGIIRLIFLFLLVIPVNGNHVEAKVLFNADTDLELKVKAGYIINFTKFVYWESFRKNEKTGPLGICLYEDDPMCGILEDYSKNKANSSSFVIKKIPKSSNKIPDCQMLFIGRRDKSKMGTLLSQLQETDVLTVSDIDGFAEHGGMIGFYIENKRIKIEINITSVNKAGLKLSAKLLEVARIVSDED